MPQCNQLDGIRELPGRGLWHALTETCIKETFYIVIQSIPGFPENRHNKISKLSSRSVRFTAFVRQHNTINSGKIHIFTSAPLLVLAPPLRRCTRIHQEILFNRVSFAGPNNSILLGSIDVVLREVDGTESWRRRTFRRAINWWASFPTATEVVLIFYSLTKC